MRKELRCHKLMIKIVKFDFNDDLVDLPKSCIKML